MPDYINEDQSILTGLFILEEMIMYKYIIESFLKMNKEEKYFHKCVDKDMKNMHKDYEKLKQDNERWFGKL